MTSPNCSTYDVIVIGAGSIGAPTSLYLSRVGFRTLVIDSRSSHLPASEYVICDPPEVWEKVVAAVGAPINSKTFLIYDSIGIAVGKIIMDQPGYRIKSVVVEKRRT